MRYESIADIYSANAKFREHFLSVVSSVTADEAVAVPDGEKWSIQQIVEHVGIVNYGMSRICAKLLAASATEGKASDGSFSLSAGFGSGLAVSADRKVEAPERVLPTGEVSIETALGNFAAVNADYESFRPDMEKYDLTGHTFPHPFFGPLNAGEWTVMRGLHEHRHTRQIERRLEQLRFVS